MWGIFVHSAELLVFAFTVGQTHVFDLFYFDVNVWKCQKYKSDVHDQRVHEMLFISNYGNRTFFFFNEAISIVLCSA